MSFVDDILNTSTIGIVPTSSEDDKIITESIIRDEIGEDGLMKLFDRVGKFAARDGILSESAETDVKLGSFDTTKCSDNAAVLAAAKEANAPEYDLYTKAILLMNACMDKMKETYGTTAKEKVEECKKVIDSDAHVANAIDEIKEEKKNECGCIH